MFLTQYFYYPTTIGEERFEIVNYDFKNSFLNFKFIYLALFFLIIFSIENFKQKNKSFYKDLNFKILTICILSFLSFAQHVIFTKNQIFIFFLIPLFLGFANIQLNNTNNRYKKYLNIILVTFCVFITLKYHNRFNLERKFHEFNNAQFSQAKDASFLGEKFVGLKWITPGSKNSDEILLELKFLKNFENILSSDKREKIVLTNYSFFSVLTEENISGYSRWYPGDESAFPKKGNKYFQNYKNLILTILKNKKIKSVYILPDIKENNFLDYIDPKCFDRHVIQFEIIKYEINDKCDDLFIWKKN